ncbi:MAG: hypothetical protein R2764_05345 [Bacteroidales bacterium]
MNRTGINERQKNPDSGNSITGIKNKRLSIYFLSGLLFLVSSVDVVVALAASLSLVSFVACPVFDEQQVLDSGHFFADLYLILLPSFGGSS